MIVGVPKEIKADEYRVAMPLGWRKVATADPGVAHGVNIHHGRVTNRAVAASFDLPHSPLDSRPESISLPIGAS
jgi:alanine dehydrogenase